MRAIPFEREEWKQEKCVWWGGGIREKIVWGSVQKATTPWRKLIQFSFFLCSSPDH